MFAPALRSLMRLYKTLAVYLRRHAEKLLPLCFSLMCRRQSQGFKKLVLASSSNLLFVLYYFLIYIVFLCSGEGLACDLRRDVSRNIAYLCGLS